MSKWSVPCPTSSSTVKRDARAGARDVGMLDQPPGGSHDLRNPGLVVGAEERRPVRGDDVVADALGEELARRRREDGAAREHDLAAVVVSPDLRLDARRGRVRARVDMRDETDGRAVVAADRLAASRRRSRARSARHRRARARGAHRRGAARGRAAWPCSDRTPTPDPTACRCARSERAGRGHPRRARRQAAIRTGPPRPARRRRAPT